MNTTPNTTDPLEQFIDNLPSAATSEQNGSDPAVLSPLEITHVVMPGQPPIPVEEANAAQQKENESLPVTQFFEDEGSTPAFLKIDGKKKVRDEYIYFGSLSESLTEVIEDLPITLSQMTGVEIKEVGPDLEESLKGVEYSKQVEVNRYLRDLYKKVRQEDGIVRRWTFQKSDGQVREITPESIEKLPANIKQALSQSIITFATSGESEYSFFPF